MHPFDSPGLGSPPRPLCLGFRHATGATGEMALPFLNK